MRGFVLRVTAAVEDAAPYADLLGGVTYRLHDAQATLARWRRTRAALAAVCSGELPVSRSGSLIRNSLTAGQAAEMLKSDHVDSTNGAPSHA